MPNDPEIKFLSLCRIFSSSNLEEILTNKELYNADEFEGVDTLLKEVSEVKEEFFNRFIEASNVEGNEEYLDFIVSIPSISTVSNALTTITFSAGVHSHEEVSSSEDLIKHSLLESLAALPILQMFMMKLLRLIDKDSEEYDLDHFLRYKNKIDSFIHHDKSVEDAPLLNDLVEYMTQILSQDIDNPETQDLLGSLGKFKAVLSTIEALRDYSEEPE